MSWHDQVPACFGTADRKFGLHPADNKRAIQMIADAKAVGATWDEVAWELRREFAGSRNDHIDGEVQRAAKMWRSVSESCLKTTADCDPARPFSQ